MHRPVADQCSLGAVYTGLFLAPVPGTHVHPPLYPKADYTALP